MDALEERYKNDLLHISTEYEMRRKSAERIAELERERVLKRFEVHLIGSIYGQAEKNLLQQQLDEMRSNSKRSGTECTYRISK